MQLLDTICELGARHVHGVSWIINGTFDGITHIARAARVQVQWELCQDEALYALGSGRAVIG